MRKILTGLVLTIAMLGAAMLGTTGPAQAGTVRCGQQNLRADLHVEVLTCGEADGNQRRAHTVLVNHSTQPVVIVTLQALISSPAYATGNCLENFVLAVGQTVHCFSPWVVATGPSQAFATVFSPLLAVDAQQRVISGSFPYLAQF